MSETTLEMPARVKAPVESYVMRLLPRLRRMAGFYARRCRLDRDDLLQEAWFGVLEGWRRMDVRIGNPIQYLAQCAKWRVLSYCRRAYRRALATLEVEPARMDPELARAEVRLDVAVMRGRLSKSQREVADHLAAGLTWREAGAVMGCSSANVAYHVRKIRKVFSERAGIGDIGGEA